MICTHSGLQNLVGNLRNLHQISQNLLTLQNLKSGFPYLKSMTWKAISRFRKELSEICSAIWNSSFQSMASEQISDFGKAPLKGWVDSPARREVHHPPLGKFLGLKSGPGWSKLQSPVVTNPNNQATKEPDHG